MENILILLIVTSAAILARSEYYAAKHNDPLARDFMHFGKRSLNMVPNYDADIGSSKRDQFTRDFMNFGKRSDVDGFSDVRDVPLEGEMLHKKSDGFDRDFMNFGKRLVPLKQSSIISNRKHGVDTGAFSREFLSFG